MLGALERDRVPARLTLSLSPPLLAMLADHLLRTRYLRHLDRLVELAEKEERRTRADERFHRVAEMYLARFWRARTIFLEEWGQDLIAAFRSYQERGLLEIITCAATHGFLPLLGVTPGAVRAQIEVAVAEHRRFFARPPEGFWLPECAYEPGLDAELARVGVRYFFVDTHGIAHATHFVEARVHQVAWLARAMDRPPIIVCPYDAELFGHWWFEGPWWLEAVLRRLATTPELRAATPGDDLARHPTVQRATPAAS